LHVVHLRDATELPASWEGWASIHYLLAAGSATFSPEMSERLKNWVETGGTLWTTLSVVPDAAATGLSPEARLARVSRGLADWLPVELTTEVSVVRELGSIEKLASRDQRIPATGRTSVARFRLKQGEVLAASRDDQLLVRVPFGLGVVVVLALDPALPPLAQWESQPAFWQQLAAEAVTRSDTETTAAKQLITTGVNDFATQLGAMVERFGNVHRTTPGMLMAALLGIVLLVGPVDYLIVHRLLKRPALTWVTYPSLVVLSSLGVVAWATSTNSLPGSVQTLDLVDLDSSRNVGRTFSLHALYGDRASRLIVKAESVWPEPRPPVSAGESVAPVVTWWAPPEGSMGGLLRPGGTFFPGAPYEIEPPKSMLTGLPVEHWGTRLLQSETHFHLQTPLIETRLETTGLGKLTGTIRHQFPAELTDWVVVHGNRLYRWLEPGEGELIRPLEPGNVWRVDQPGVSQRELRGYLTGARARTVKSDSSGSGGTIAVEQAAYDPLNLDPVDIVRMMSFHEDVGGTGYTGLSNKLLSGSDLSLQLRLGRAVLIGKLKAPASRLDIDADTLTDPTTTSKSSKEFQSAEHTTIIRCLLPVTNGATELAPLPKLNP
jgi:hypothetical protein